MMETEDDLRIIILGPAGAGKSRTGNSILGDPTAFKVGPGGEAVTKKCSSVTCNRYGKRLLVVDTPGLWGEENENRALLEEVKKCVDIAHPGPHVFLLCTEMGRLIDYDNVFLRYCHLFGKDMFNYSIIVFTNYDVWKQGFEDDMNKSPDVDVYIRSLPSDFKRILSNSSNRFVTFENKCTEEEMNKQVEGLLENIKHLKTFAGDNYFKRNTSINEKKDNDIRPVKKQEGSTQNLFNIVIGNVASAGVIIAGHVALFLFARRELSD